MAAISQNKTNNAKKPTPWQAHVEREQTVMAAISQNKTSHAENQHPDKRTLKAKKLEVVSADNREAQD